MKQARDDMGLVAWHDGAMMGYVPELPDRLCRRPIPHKRMRWHPVDAEHSFPAGAQLFTDGSCFEGRDPRTATAGFSVVWLDQGQLKKV
eukprot:6584496-Prorocentrum_lima.AAC.1